MARPPSAASRASAGAMVAPDPYLRQCVDHILEGTTHLVVVDDVACRLHGLGRAAFQELMSEALRPQLDALRKAASAGGAGALSERWTCLHAGASALGDITAGMPWGGSSLECAALGAASRALLAGPAAAPALEALQEAQVAAVAQFRADPDSLGARGLRALRGTAALLAQPSAEGARQRYTGALLAASQEAFQRQAATALQAVVRGGPPEGWAARCAHCVQAEQFLDRVHCGRPSGESRLGCQLASRCAAAWLTQSMAVLPWILAWLLAPAALGALGGSGLPGDGCQAQAYFASLRAALDASADPQTLHHLRSALVSAVALLLQIARVKPEIGAAALVRWAAALLSATHAVCEALLPDVGPAVMAAALAPKFAAAFGGNGAAAEELRPPPLPPWLGVDMSDGVWDAGTADMRSLDVARLAPRLRAALAARAPPWCAGMAMLEAWPSERAAEALAFAVHQEARAAAGGAAGGASRHAAEGRLAPLVLLLRLTLAPSTDSTTALHAHARLAAQRALGAAELQADVEEYLVSFLRKECGAANLALHHLGELRRDAAGRGELTAEGCPWRAVVCSAAAAKGAGLATGSPADAPELSAQVPSLFQASRPLLEARERWSSSYHGRFPHRKLRWQPALGSCLLVWRHARGRTEVAASELQAHLLLALGGGRAVPEHELLQAAAAWEGADGEAGAAAWRQALESLCSPTAASSSRGAAAPRRSSPCGRAPRTPRGHWTWRPSCCWAPGLPPRGQARQRRLRRRVARPRVLPWWMQPSCAC
ncbi:unnamed protein product [Prorocentrum cordatum]|uniref:Cullin family profile domain-containing protein n=1 Tax=Prorocentrum cordatum TaxID=2364126 RepID=A0ABN9RIZ8_9DINO|nr:unnamed protein product [Polarella glacialis]